MPRICFKPLTWYIEVHHVRPFFSVWRHDFFVSRDAHSQRVYLQEAFFVCHRTVSMAAVYQLKIKYDQDKFGAVFLDAFDTINFSRQRLCRCWATIKLCWFVVYNFILRFYIQNVQQHRFLTHISTKTQFLYYTCGRGP